LSQLVSDLAQWIVEAVYYFGYPGVAFLMMLSNLQLIPSQLVLPLAGYLFVPSGADGFNGRSGGRRADPVRFRVLAW
jgi:membrane protein DedA with SNARE-associated domain